MGYITRVQVHQGPQNLLNDSLCLIFLEAPLVLSFQVRMQTFPLRILHHQVNILRSIDCLEQFNDI